ncbi:hypothetical protein NLX86_31625 [Streptomyces sp. A3M-1-3]|uniref:hypothetical protein n=1 Tax=Streptomyces sp. A3M-1-3 TaxID=2962044 RepID=UPI0020B76F66|nr:hypothetical protein [Streptomyces sp. A3M-1-3]MCP3822473.1 hypothetical protein [Streptomyces sp. A3M-1-3]
MLPSEGGSGGTSSGFFNPFEFVKDAVGDMVAELSSFTKFRDRVDQLLKDLKEGPAGPNKVGQGAMARGQLGGGESGWHEADGLFDSYTTVIEELEKLSKLLSDSIEGMGIAVMASHNGYENLDEDIRRRMAAIGRHTTDDYKRHHPSAEKSQGSTQPGDTGAGTAGAGSGLDE